MENPESAQDAESLGVYKALGGNLKASELLKAHTQSNAGESRPSQELMSEKVSENISEGSRLVVEAGTGTGKSLAYLSAAVVNGKRTVIATATNQLSDQLFYKDCPSLVKTSEEIGIKFSYASLKGRQNYACLAKIAELQRQDDAANSMELDGLEYPSSEDSNDKINNARILSNEINTLKTWTDTTESGEISDAPATSTAAWQAISVTSKQCPGASNCPFGDVCFAEIAKKKAKTSNIIITNHALLSQGASLSGDSGLEILGSPEVLIVDEAHQLASSLTSALSFVVSEETILAVLKEISKASAMLGTVTSKLSLEEAIDDFMDAASTVEPGRLSSKPVALTSTVYTLITKLMQSRNSITAGLKSKKIDDSTRAQCEIAMSAIESAVAELTVIKEPEKPEFVQWAEKSKDNKPLLYGAPLDVAPYFSQLTNEVSSVIATSATMKVGDSFHAIQAELGMDTGETVDVGSPFEYNKQGILYVPRGGSYPAPVGIDRKEHAEAVKQSNLELVRASGGRALCLFTTTRAAVETGQWLREQLDNEGINVLIAGEASADHLVKSFRDDETSVLCATMGMWQGTDVPGNSCILVTIDKIPFPTPDDILNEARSQNASAQGRNGFYAVSVKNAAINLAQGVGRLIRRGTDKGVVAILDNRLRTKGYGETILTSLPNFVRSDDEKNTIAALERLKASLPAPEVVANRETKTRAIDPIHGSVKAARTRKSTPVSSAKTKSIGKRKS